MAVMPGSPVTVVSVVPALTVSAAWPVATAATVVMPAPWVPVARRELVAVEMPVTMALAATAATVVSVVPAVHPRRLV
jgi:hypothetical protein